MKKWIFGLCASFFCLLPLSAKSPTKATGIVYGHSDSCDSGSVLDFVGAKTRCSSLSGEAWSVWVEGTCYNIQDTDAPQACDQVKSRLPGFGGVYPDSDDCSGKVLEAISAKASCKNIDGPAWSLWANGTCENISDTTAAQGCFQIQGQLDGSGVIYSDSDSCSGEITGTVHASVDCSTFSGPAWSFSSGGVCTDLVPDVDGEQACLQAKGKINNAATLFSDSDSCSGTAIGALHAKTDCNQFQGNTWSYSVGGSCTDLVPDVDGQQACLQAKGQLPTSAAIFDSSDSCQGNAIGAVHEKTDCSRFEGVSWSYSAAGICKDLVPDVSGIQGCMRAKGAIPNSAAIFDDTDDCSGNVIGTVNSKTNCGQFSGKAWAYSVKGVCHDIADTTFSQACMQSQGNFSDMATVYGLSDSCSGEVLGTVTRRTKCSEFSGTSWSVSVEGQCLDIDDTDGEYACQIAKAAL